MRCSLLEHKEQPHFLAGAVHKIGSPAARDFGGRLGGASDLLQPISSNLGHIRTYIVAVEKLTIIE